MTCASLLDRALALLDGSLGTEDRDEALRHLEGCGDCRALLAALATAPQGGDDPALVDAILARTSGGACDGARALLCAWVDGELGAEDEDLVNAHLRRCGMCDALARALLVLRDELPRLAEAEPDPGFVDAVLARTSRRPRTPAPRERLAASIARLFERPRIALEGAFLASALALVPLALVPAPLAVASARHAASKLEVTVTVGTRTVWEAGESFVVEKSSAIAAATRTWFRSRRGTFLTASASGETGGANRPVDRSDQAAQETTR